MCLNNMRLIIDGGFVETDVGQFNKLCKKGDSQREFWKLFCSCPCFPPNNLLLTKGLQYNFPALKDQWLNVD